MLLLAWEPGLLYDALNVSDEERAQSRVAPRPAADVAAEMLAKTDQGGLAQLAGLVERERAEAKAERPQHAPRGRAWEYCPAELAAALRRLPVAAADELLARLVELVEAHARASHSDLAELEVPPLGRCLGFLNAFLDGRRVGLALSLQSDDAPRALVRRLQAAQAQLAEAMQQVEGLLGLLHALSLPSVPPDERLVDAWRLPV